MFLALDHQSTKQKYKIYIYNTEDKKESYKNKDKMWSSRSSQYLGCGFLKCDVVKFGK